MGHCKRNTSPANDLEDRAASDGPHSAGIFIGVVLEALLNTSLDQLVDLGIFQGPRLGNLALAVLCFCSCSD